MWLSLLENTADHEWSMTKVVTWYVIPAQMRYCCCLMNSVLYHFFFIMFIEFFSLMQIVSTLVSSGKYSDKMLVYAENHNQVINCFCFKSNFLFFNTTTKFLDDDCNWPLNLAFQSISGGKSFAEILFGEITEHSPGSSDSLLRGCSLHKVCQTPPYISVSCFIIFENFLLTLCST